MGKEINHICSTTVNLFTWSRDYSQVWKLEEMSLSRLEVAALNNKILGAVYSVYNIITNS